LTTTTAKELLAKKPEDVIRLAVRGMLPKNRLGRKLIKKLKVYTGSEHPHAAQQPEVLEF
jgi:large subunit ribosomal protein L13